MDTRVGLPPHRSRGLRGPWGGAPLIERELVAKRQWLTAADVLEALTYTKLLPGSTGPQVVAYLGCKLGGWPGSAVAMAAFLFPAALMTLALAVGYVTVTALPALQPAMHGLMAAIVELCWLPPTGWARPISPTASPWGSRLRCRGRSRPGRQCGGNCGGRRIARCLSLRYPASQTGITGGNAMILDLFTRCVSLACSPSGVVQRRYRSLSVLRSGRQGG